MIRKDISMKDDYMFIKNALNIIVEVKSKDKEKVYSIQPCIRVHRIVDDIIKFIRYDNLSKSFSKYSIVIKFPNNKISNTFAKQVLLTIIDETLHIMHEVDIKLEEI